MSTNSMTRTSTSSAPSSDGDAWGVLSYVLAGMLFYGGIGWLLTTGLARAGALGALPPANQVLADVLLSYWPRESWQAVLPAGWQLIDQPLRRELRDEKGELVSEITYQQQVGDRNPVRLWQHAFDYQLTIQTLPPQTSSNEAEDANRE